MIVVLPLLFGIVAAEFQSLLAGEFTRGITISASANHVVTFIPTPQAPAMSSVVFKVFFCKGGADIFLSIGPNRMPTPEINQYQQLYVRGDIDAVATANGPGSSSYNLALYPIVDTLANDTVVVDVVAATSAAAIDMKIPVPGGDKSVRIKSKKDRTNTIAWTPTGVAGDSYQVWVALEALPTDIKTDGRTPDTACGAEAAMEKRGSAIIGTTDTAEMTFDVTDVRKIQTAAVVVTRPGGYKAVYVTAFLTVQGDTEFTNIVNGKTRAPPASPSGNGGGAAELALSAFVAVASATTMLLN
jgi:hypothetical protein